MATRTAEVGQSGQAVGKQVGTSVSEEQARQLRASAPRPSEDRVTVYMAAEIELELHTRFQRALLNRQAALRRAGQRGRFAQYQAVEEALELWAGVQEGTVTVRR